jgi:V8-like Glu-specific endopeptidase
VIGYPLGGGLSVSLQDSYWLDTNGKVLHYRTPTEPGSSGSPVFDEKFWSLIALHHAGDTNLPRLKGSGTYEANEGIAIKAILKATRKAGYPRTAKKARPR